VDDDVRVFGVSGYSSTGKTTLIERLIDALIRRGHRVATVKSTKDDLPFADGTDTGRHWAAGAETTVLLGPATTVITERRRLRLHEALAHTEADIVIVEGMKEEDIPRFWCLGNDIGSAPEEEVRRKGLKGFVLWGDVGRQRTKLKTPAFRSDDIEHLTDIVEREAVSLKALNA